MRSKLLNTIASVFAMAAALAFVAGGAMAQDGPKVSGGAGVGFGQVQWDTGATSDGPGDPVDGSALNAQIESNVIVSGKNENVDYYFRMRARGTTGDTIVKGFSEGTFNDGQMQTVRVRVGTNFGPVRVEIGRLPGIGGTGMADLRPVRAPGGFRHNVNNLGFFDAGALNVRFAAGPVKVGVAIQANGCQVNCSGGFKDSSSTSVTAADTLTTSTTSVSTGNAQTIMPYVQGAFGPVKFGVRYATSSQDVIVSSSTTDVTVSTGASTTTGGAPHDGSVDRSGFVGEVAVAAGPGGIGLEYTSLPEGCLDPIGPAGTACNDTTVTGPGLAVTWTGLLVQYSSSEEDDGDATTTNATSSVVSGSFLFDIGGGKIGPEVAIAKSKPSDSTLAVTPKPEASGRLIRVLMTTGF
jgi:hypothetical protein